MDLLTQETINGMNPGDIIAKGEVENSPDGVYMTEHNKNHMMRWIAIVGEANDWAIYIDWAHKDWLSITKHGDKVRSIKNIKQIINCDSEARESYRH